MYALSNDTLEVAILDPVADRARLGTRYCTGGYIFSVTDAKLGSLMSGPTYPDSFNVFDGQGIPDSFNLSPLLAWPNPRHPHVPPPDVPRDVHALVLGVGVCDLESSTVLEWCDWKVDASETIITMSTHHAHQGFEVDLVRTVSLIGRTLRSWTQVSNGGRPVPIRWFPHPFFPHPETDELVKFNIRVTFPENPGYMMAPSGFIARKNWPWHGGPYQALDHAATTNLVVMQKHPKLGLVGATCSYIPSFFPIWGNANTFSWEPFLERSLAPGQATSWWIDYDF
jgi:hypothetical protein